MKQLLPTLLPIVALIGAAVTPIVHSWLATPGHALIALTVSTIAAVVNHWIEPPK